MGGRQEAPRHFSQKDINKALEVVRGLAVRPESDMETINAAGHVIAELEEWRSNTGKNEGKSAWRRFLDFFVGDKPSFEAKYALGVQPSIPSSRGWQVSHPKYDSNIDFIEVQSGDGNYTGMLSINHYYGSPFLKFGSEITNITTHAYSDSRGERRVILCIWESNNTSYPGDYGMQLQECLVANQSTDELDARVVVFNKINTGNTLYLKLQAAPDANAVSFIQMKPMQRS